MWECRLAGKAPLPATASIEEAFERLHGCAIPTHLGQSIVAGGARIEVVSADPAIRHWLKDALQAAGFVSLENGNNLPADAAVWDAPVWDDRAAEELRQFHNADASRPLLVLIGGVRPHQIAEARACGADRVLPKIAPITAILEQLAELIKSSAKSRL
jgi:DNA-binding NarL/FixJ family response regulator